MCVCIYIYIYIYIFMTGRGKRDKGERTDPSGDGGNVMAVVVARNKKMERTE
jgi:hypothetical protein